MKKVVTLLLVSVMAITCLLGCSSDTTDKTVSYTFEVETGDSVKVSLTGTDYILKQDDGIFTVENKDGATIVTGIFISKEMYDSYVAMLQTESVPRVSNFTDGTTDNCEYVSYEYIEPDVNGNDYHEYNYVCYIQDSNTGVILGSVENTEVVTTIFDALNFTLMKK